MYKLKPEPQFKKDYRQLKRVHPELINDLMQALEQLQINVTLMGKRLKNITPLS